MVMTELRVYEDVHPIWKEKPTDFASVLGSKDKIEYWVDIMIDTVPAWSRLPWRRWWCEVHVRPSAHFSPLGDDAPKVWYHYYRHDFHARSLRHAMTKAVKVAEDLADLMQENPDERPVPYSLDTQ